MTVEVETKTSTPNNYVRILETIETVKYFKNHENKQRILNLVSSFKDNEKKILNIMKVNDEGDTDFYTIGFQEGILDVVPLN